jgi:hypothetical protein
MAAMALTTVRTMARRMTDTAIEMDQGGVSFPDPADS